MSSEIEEREKREERVLQQSAECRDSRESVKEGIRAGFAQSEKGGQRRESRGVRGNDPLFRSDCVPEE